VASLASWFEKKSQIVQAICAIVMAGAALGALVFVPLQIAANDRTSREQAAREIYREFLNISIQRPDLVAQDYCALVDPVQKAAYEAYVEYLLYTAEQVLALSQADWQSTIAARLQGHQGYLCTFDDNDIASMTAPVSDLVERLRFGCAIDLAC